MCALLRIGLITEGARTVLPSRCSCAVQEDVDWLVMHQANQRILDAAAQVRGGRVG